MARLLVILFLVLFVTAPMARSQAPTHAAGLHRVAAGHQTAAAGPHRHRRWWIVAAAAAGAVVTLVIILHNRRPPPCANCAASPG